MLPVAVVAHSVPGRTRLRIEARREDAAYFATAATVMSGVAGIAAVHPRPRTGSIILEHATSMTHIGQAAAEAGLFRIDSGHSRSAATSAPSLRMTPALAMAVALGGFALWQLRKGRILPPALTLAFYAADLVRLLPRAELPVDPE